MRKKNKYHKDWHRKFAWTPINIDGETVWLEFYEMRYVTIEGVGCKRCEHWSGTFEFRTIGGE